MRRVAAASLTRPTPVDVAAALPALHARVSAAHDYAAYLLDAQRTAQLAAEPWARYANSGERLWLESQLQQLTGAADVYSVARTHSAVAAAAVMRVPADDAPFVESAFIRAVLNKLENVFCNSFAVNLLLTSVLTQLAQSPHPLVHTYLLDPAAPLLNGGSGAVTAEAGGSGRPPAGPRALLRVVSDLLTQVETRARMTPGFEASLAETNSLLAPGSAHSRRLYTEFVVAGPALLVAPPSAPVPPVSISGAVSAGSDVEMTPEQVFLDGVVVLREFAKEIVATARAKSDLAAVQAAASQRSFFPSRAGAFTGAPVVATTTRHAAAAVAGPEGRLDSIDLDYAAVELPE
jgi:hypothetical protein